MAIRINPDRTLAPGRDEDLLAALRATSCMDLEVPAVRTRRLVVCAQEGAFRRVILNVLFTGDSSVVVDLSHFDDTRGIAAVCSVPAGQSPHSIVLAGMGTAKVTSERLKYTHHSSGVCNLNKTGRVQSIIRRQAVPLSQDFGHMFTLVASGTHRIAPIDPKHLGGPPTSTKVVITLGAAPSGFKVGKTLEEQGSPIRGMRVTGWWHTQEGLRGRMLGRRPSSPVMMDMQTPYGRRFGVLLAPPKGRAHDDKVLLLQLEPNIDERRPEPGASLIGGFDSPDVAWDFRRGTSFLAVMYPCRDYKTLLRQVGSMDLKPSES